MSDTRSRFEEWAKQQGLPTRRMKADLGGYSDARTDWALLAYQAAEAQAVRECLKLCEERVFTNSAAEAIRAAFPHVFKE